MDRQKTGQTDGIPDQGGPSVGFRRIKVKTMWGQNVVENMSVSKAFSPWAGTLHQNPGGREGMN